MRTKNKIERQKSEKNIKEKRITKETHHIWLIRNI